MSDQHPVAWRFRSRLDDDEWSDWSKPIEHDPSGAQGMGPPEFEVQALYPGRETTTGEVAALRGALEEILGFACEWQHERSAQVVARKAEAALASDAGRAEAEVLRAAVHHEEVAEEWLDAMERGPASDLPGSPIYHKLAKAKDALSAAVDALLAARGGEGEG